MIRERIVQSDEEQVAQEIKRMILWNVICGSLSLVIYALHNTA